MEIERVSLTLFILTLLCVGCGDDDPSGGTGPSGQVGEDNSPQGGQCVPDSGGCGSNAQMSPPEDGMNDDEGVNGNGDGSMSEPLDPPEDARRV